MGNSLKKSLLSLILVGSSIIPNYTFSEDFLKRYPDTYSLCNCVDGRNNINSEHELEIDRALILGVGKGIEDAKKYKELEITGPFGDRFDYVFASNFKGNVIINIFHAACSQTTGCNFISPRDQYPDFKRLKVKELWCHSQGSNTFIVWSKKDEIRADKVYLVGLPMYDWHNYIDKIEKATEKSGTKEINIYQNRGRFKDIFFDEEFSFDKTKGFPYPRLKGNKTKFIWNRFYTSKGKDRSYLKYGIYHREFYNLSKDSHLLRDYYLNIINTEKRKK